jgi:hypothetical protein
LEHRIYMEILPAMAVPALRCYGWIDGQDDPFGWLFLEDAGEQNYCPEQGGHAALAGLWLGKLHARAAQASLSVPDRGPAHYLSRLRFARASLLRHQDRPDLRADDRSVLKRLAAHCAVLEARWREVENHCSEMPGTLVHGDFVAKNVYIRADPVGPVLLALDWELAGWGVPAPDLVQGLFRGRVASVSPDLASYWAVVRESWPHLTLADVHRWAAWGKLLRLLAMIAWFSAQLASPWLKKPLAGLRIYLDEMTRAIQEVGWVA